jgi:two-component system nitrogen regulation response regulator GlnG
VSVGTRAQEILERTLIDAALTATGGKRVEAAARLGWGRNTLTRKLKR